MTVYPTCYLTIDEVEVPFHSLTGKGKAYKVLYKHCDTQDIWFKDLLGNLKHLENANKAEFEEILIRLHSIDVFMKDYDFKLLRTKVLKHKEPFRCAVLTTTGIDILSFRIFTEGKEDKIKPILEIIDTKPEYMIRNRLNSGKCYKEEITKELIESNPLFIPIIHKLLGMKGTNVITTQIVTEDNKKEEAR